MSEVSYPHYGRLRLKGLGGGNFRVREVVITRHPDEGEDADSFRQRVCDQYPDAADIEILMQDGEPRLATISYEVETDETE